MKKLILLISACALCVPCFGQDAPVYPCAPAQEVVEPCAPAADIDCAGEEQAAVDCGQAEVVERVIVTKRVSRRSFRTVTKHECAIKGLLQRIKAKRAAKRVRQNVVQPCAPAQVVQPCEPVGCAECF